jgi:DNA-directed RNA polymerase specialized sigma24 family protein
MTEYPRPAGDAPRLRDIAAARTAALRAFIAHGLGALPEHGLAAARAFTTASLVRERGGDAAALASWHCGIALRLVVEMAHGLSPRPMETPRASLEALSPPVRAGVLARLDGLLQPLGDELRELLLLAACGAIEPAEAGALIVLPAAIARGRLARARRRALAAPALATA